MIGRRDVLAGLSCVGALGVAEYLRPRDKLVLLPRGIKIKDVVPLTVGKWGIGNGGDIVIPRTEGTASTRIYNDQLARGFRDTTGVHPDIMIMVAYGETQNDSLQVHRPEQCYPANGFSIADRRFIDIPNPAGPAIPAVALTAVVGNRIEDIVYWVRVGDDMPRTSAEQRANRLRSALAGVIGDGLLFRASAVRPDNGAPQQAEIIAFLGEMIGSLRQRDRVTLLGRNYAA
jgi:EpsI family protein